MNMVIIYITNEIRMQQCAYINHITTYINNNLVFPLNSDHNTPDLVSDCSQGNELINIKPFKSSLHNLHNNKSMMVIK